MTENLDPSDLDPADLAADALASQTLRARSASPVTLDEVRSLAEHQLLLEVELEALEAQVDAKKRELRAVSEEQLPNLLLDAGLPGLTLADGSTINVQDNIFASIGDDNREAAHRWLREQGLGDLIKNVVSVTFGKGEDADALLLLHNIQEMGDNDALHFGAVEQKEAVHASTLRSFVKERLKSGLPLPAETFKLFEGKKTVIKRPKRKES